MKTECQWRSIFNCYRTSCINILFSRINLKKEIRYRLSIWSECGQNSFFKPTNPDREKSRWSSGNLLATPDAFGSLCVFFMCSTSASPPNTTLWHIGQGVAVAPPIISAACCCKTPRCSWSSCSTGRWRCGHSSWKIRTHSK